MVKGACTCKETLQDGVGGQEQTDVGEIGTGWGTPCQRGVILPTRLAVSRSDVNLKDAVPGFKHLIFPALWGRVRNWGHSPVDRPSRIPLRISPNDMVNGLKRGRVRQ